MSGDFWRGLKLPWLNRKDVEQEIEDELAHHMELRAKELIDEGVDPVEAYVRVAAQFGDARATKQQYVHRRSAQLRRQRTQVWFSELIQDMRFGARQLLRYPGFAVIAVLTLALGIGVNTSVFSVVNSVLLRPLPYPDADRIVRIWGTRAQQGERHDNLSPPDLLDMARETSTLAALAAFTPGSATVTGQGDATLTREVRALPSIFEVLAIRPLMGRAFTAEEAIPGGPLVVMLTHGYWQRVMGADPDVIGRPLQVEHAPHTIVGVLPQGLIFPTFPAQSQPELLRPLRLQPQNGRGGHWLRAIGRLSANSSIEAATEDLSTIASRLEEEYPASNTGRSARAESLKQATVGSSARGLWILQGAVLLVLLIASANLANLMLVRGTARTTELAVRHALGAGRGRLVRQLLGESAFLALLGGAGGLLLALWSTRLLAAMPGAGIPRAEEITVNPVVLLFCAAIAISTVLLASLAPLAQTLGTDVRSALTGAGDGGRRSGIRLRDALVAAEAAFALVLLVGAGLLMRSFAQLVGEDAGVDTNNTMIVELILPQDRYDSNETIGAFYRDFVTELSELPGLVAVGGVNNLPFLFESCDGFVLPDRPRPPAGQGPCASNQLVTPGYFAAAGISMREGRGFSGADRPDSRPVVIVSEVFADRFYPDRSALGEIVSYNQIEREIVGMSQAVRRLGLDRDPPPEMFIPHAQSSWDTQMFIVLRASEDGERTVSRVREALAAKDPNVPVGRVLPLRQLVSATVAAPRFRTLTLGVFAALALLLAGIGIYGVMSHSVSRRTRELGLRIALGADARRVRSQVMWEALRITALGLVVGMIGVLAASRVLEGLLYQTDPLDPLSLVGAPLLLLAVGLLGSYLPARRATTTDPLNALRGD